MIAELTQLQKYFENMRRRNGSLVLRVEKDALCSRLEHVVCDGSVGADKAIDTDRV